MRVGAVTGQCAWDGPASGRAAWIRRAGSGRTGSGRSVRPSSRLPSATGTEIGAVPVWRDRTHRDRDRSAPGHRAHRDEPGGDPHRNTRRERNRDQVVAAASLLGIPVQATERVLTLLAAGGVIDDFPATTLREVPGARRARLAAELATTSLAHRDSDGGARALARRRASTVCVEGAGPIAQAIARILSASGIGHVQRAQPATTLQTRGEQTRGEQTRAGQTRAGQTQPARREPARCGPGARSWRPGLTS